MANWTTVKDWAPGVLTSANLDTYVSDNTQHLHEQRVRSATGVTNLKVEHGVYIVTGANLASGGLEQHAITFAQTFTTGTVIVLATCLQADDAGGTPYPYQISVGVDAISGGTCNIFAYNRHGAELRDVTIGWLAIGPVA